jgi:hypothetical protein
VIGIAITSRIDAPIEGVVLTAASFENGGLPRLSKVIPVRVFTQSQDLLLKYFGRLQAEPFNEAIRMLLSAIH